jgi:glycerophosphoryl diester phosphodiesterase
MVIVFGHRGAPGYPRQGENTFTSFKKALECEAAGLEFDVRRCGDGRLVVIHDERIDRTTNGCGRVSKLSYDELVQFDAGFGDRIPLLTDVLDEFGGRCWLNIELKDMGIASEVKRLVLERRLEAQVIVSAFDWTELRPVTPEVPIALLSSSRWRLVSTARELRAKAIHPRRDIVTPRLIAAARTAKLLIHAWTVNDPAEMSRLHELGVDGIFTDFPDRCSGKLSAPR